MLDFHSHILPGLDDGASDMETALEMARMAVFDGITRMVATPHYLEGVYENDRDTILARTGEFQGILNSKGILLELIPGCEAYLSPNIPELLAKGKLITINDNGKYLLVELPMETIPEYTEDVLLELKGMGVTPIIAHPERNLEICRRTELALNLVQKGCLLQLNAGSFTGLYGDNIKKTACFMANNSLIHLIGSDAHSCGGRSPGITKAWHILTAIDVKIPEEVKNINKRVLLGEKVDLKVPLYLHKEKRSLLGFFKGIFVDT
ncbi:tyrosine-protein phosphatase [Phosphitispora sp. TUW77]|uniref:tyrosine-protein phosphatase n=1 Tax=Phosphitispora sp. TUW77 TaxID=3152361 RepID=UPI003AB35469